MRTKDIERCLRCLDTIDINSSRVDGEIAYLKECFNQAKITNNKRKLRMAQFWKKHGN